MRHRLPASLLLLPLLAASGTLAAADLRGVRLVEDGQGTRAVVEVGELAGYKLFSLQNPDRLVLDLAQTHVAPSFRAPGANGVVANVRTGNPAPDTVRLVFDLGAPMQVESHLERDGKLSRLTVVLAAPGKSIAIPGPAALPPARESVAIAPIASSPVDTLLEPNLAPPPDVQLMQAPIIAKPLVSPPPRLTGPGKAGRTVRDVIGDGERKLVVAIDAGHGGKDPGAHGPSGVREKNVTLAVAKELARQVNADPGMRAVLIRDGDVFVPLQQRYMKARAAQADLFISIHADASPNGTASGASVFVLSTRGASSQAARWLADQENAADLVGGVSLDQKDPNLAAVLLDLSQSATMRAADGIAAAVLGALKNVG
ncbi:MAG: N-acetylmuramoyl-L-alanine amidase, partial [Arenimonas sp.]